jgi:hypothetical protein
MLKTVSKSFKINPKKRLKILKQAQKANYLYIRQLGYGLPLTITITKRVAISNRTPRQADVVT